MKVWKDNNIDCCYFFDLIDNNYCLYKDNLKDNIMYNC